VPLDRRADRLSGGQRAQPADRFWLFQGIDTALFAALAVALVLVAVRLVRRRVA
jgi:hypothetical protein